MLKKRQVTLKILLLLISVDLIETFAQFCFKKSALSGASFQIGNLGDIFNFLKVIVPSGYFWAGLISVILIFITWSTVLSKIDLSVAVPVCSFSYITVPLTALIFFHENISFLRWSGIFFILMGVILVSRSSMHREALK